MSILDMQRNLGRELTIRPSTHLAEEALKPWSEALLETIMLDNEAYFDVVRDQP